MQLLRIILQALQKKGITEMLPKYFVEPLQASSEIPSMDWQIATIGQHSLLMLKH